MTLSPLLTASLAIQLHALFALALILLTAAIFMIPRGKTAHRVLGWTWVIGMGIVAVSSFWISEIRIFGPFSYIHILSVTTLIGLVVAVRAARNHQVAKHRTTMKRIAFGALVVAGGFTFLPGRIMFQIITGS